MLAASAAGQCRVGVALDDDRARGVVGEEPVQAVERVGDLGGAWQAADAGQAFRFGYPQLVREVAGQLGFVVLPGVDDPCRRAEEADQLRELDQLGAGAQDDGDGSTGQGGGGILHVTHGSEHEFQIRER